MTSPWYIALSAIATIASIAFITILAHRRGYDRGYEDGSFDTYHRGLGRGL